ncbi:MAG: hypothetical protein ACK40G_12380 [Cytophagaceae bacterium]
MNFTSIFFTGILSAFVFVSVHAQQDTNNFDITIKNTRDAYSFTDGIDGMAYLLSSNKQYQIMLLNSPAEQQIKSTYIKTTSEKKDEVLGACLDQRYVTFFFSNPKSRSFSYLKTDRRNGENTYKTFMLREKNEHVFEAFEMNNVFYILTVEEYKNEINLISVSDGGEKIDKEKYLLEMNSFYAMVSKRTSRATESKVDIHYVDYNKVNTIRGTYRRNKLYTYDNKIFMTFDEPGMTHLVTIDPIEKSAAYKKLNFSLERGNNSPQKQGNSFLYYKTLFRVSMSPDQLNLSALNLDSMYLVNSFNVFPEGEIDIANTPLLMEGSSSGSSGDETVLKKSTQFFKKALTGEIAVAVNPQDSGYYNVQLGSYEEFVQYRGGYSGGWGAPGISFGMGMGMGMGGFYSPMYMPGYMGMAPYRYPAFGPSYYPSSSVTKTRTVYFKSLLDSESLTHQQGNVAKTGIERMNDYFEGKFRNYSPELVTTVTYGDKMILGYLIKRTNKYQLVEFKK